jgi:hypothetical protein
MKEIKAKADTIRVKTIMNEVDKRCKSEVKIEV